MLSLEFIGCAATENVMLNAVKCLETNEKHKADGEKKVIVCWRAQKLIKIKPMNEIKHTL